MSSSKPTLAEIIDDLTSRFVINVPQEELGSYERILFMIEQAHWFYLDVYRGQDPSLPNYTLKELATLIFKSAPVSNVLTLSPISMDQILKNFGSYKLRVPVCGAIILNKALTKVLLVKGPRPSSSWGFPKGKINEDETEVNCAIREVLEETGFDISDLIRSNDYIELPAGERPVRLYIIVGVEETISFKPKCKYEISKVEWHSIQELLSKNKGTIRHFLVTSFLLKLVHRLHAYKSKKTASHKPIQTIKQTSEAMKLSLLLTGDHHQMTKTESQKLSKSKRIPDSDLISTFEDTSIHEMDGVLKSREKITRESKKYDATSRRSSSKTLLTKHKHHDDRSHEAIPSQVTRIPSTSSLFQFDHESIMHAYDSATTKF